LLIYILSVALIISSLFVINPFLSAVDNRYEGFFSTQIGGVISELSG